MVGMCESCGSPDEEILRVVRLYVVHSPDEERHAPDPGAEPPPPAATDGDEEQWCFSCRTHYAHRLID